VKKPISDAFGLGRVEGTELPSTLAVLLGADLRGAGKNGIKFDWPLIDPAPLRVHGPRL
jgi:hypothetical protein